MLLYSISNDLFDGPPTSQPEFLEGLSSVFLILYMMLYEMKHNSKLSSPVKRLNFSRVFMKIVNNIFFVVLSFVAYPLNSWRDISVFQIHCELKH